MRSKYLRSTGCLLRRCFHPALVFTKKNQVETKLATARFYMARILPQTSSLFATLNAHATPIMVVEEDWF